MFFNSTTLDIALSMVLLYYLLSLVCSALNEWITSLLRWRSNTLVEGIASLLNDTVMQKQIDEFYHQPLFQRFLRLFGRNQQPELVGLTKTIYQHVLINGLGRRDPSNVSNKKAISAVNPANPASFNTPFTQATTLKDGLPSYITGRTFAQVVLDLILLEADANHPALGALSLAPQNQPQSMTDAYRKVRNILVSWVQQDDNGLKDPAKVLLLLIDQAGIDPNKLEQADKLRQELEAAHAAFTTLRGANAINAQVSTALDQIKWLESQVEKLETEFATGWTQAQTNIETYFNDAMERVSGWYKRDVQKVIVGLALIIVVILNADSLAIISQLASSSTLRAAIVAAAPNFVVQAPSTSGATAKPQASGAQPANTSPTAGNATSITTTTSITDSIHQVVSNVDSIKELGSPIGWHALPNSLGAWVFKLLGLVITTLAVTMGAPFWFDLLNKLVNLRSTGDKPEETAKKPE